MENKHFDYEYHTPKEGADAGGWGWQNAGKSGAAQSSTGSGTYRYGYARPGQGTDAQAPGAQQSETGAPGQNPRYTARSASDAERALQAELENQLRGLGQSVTDGLRYGFEGRGDELGQRAKGLGSAVLDAVDYGLTRGIDEARRAYEDARASKPGTNGGFDYGANGSGAAGGGYRYGPNARYRPGAQWDTGRNARAEARAERFYSRTARGRAASAPSWSLRGKANVRFGVGLALAITGGVLAFGLLLAGGICIAAAPYAGLAADIAATDMVGKVLTASGLPFLWMAICGGRSLSAAKRLRAYADVIGSQEQISVLSLAEALQKPVGRVRRDLRKLLRKGWLAGWLDSKAEMLYLTSEAWQAAHSGDAAFEAGAAGVDAAGTDASRTPRAGEAAAAAAEANTAQASAAADAGQAAAGSASIDAESVRRFVTVLGQEKQMMDDAQAVAELDHMQTVSASIGQWVAEHPESGAKVRRFAAYYMPTTLKLLHTYNEVRGQQGDNADNIRRDIAGILHTLNTAYDNLYDNLLSDVALDVSSEIAALQGMLARDGLSDSPFDQPQG